MNGKASSWITLAIFLTLALAGPATAQLRTGNLYGVVIDDEGMPLRGATVTLAVGGASRVQVTDENGFFHYLGLSPGDYDVTAKLEGFLDGGRMGVVISVGRNTVFELMLDLVGSPRIDPRRISNEDPISREELEKIPTACTPWAALFACSPGSFSFSPCGAPPTASERLNPAAPPARRDRRRGRG